MPAYSIAKSRKEPSFIPNNPTPGAGAYSTENWAKNSRVKTAGSASMTKTRRFFRNADSSTQKIGPGAYNPQKPAAKIAPSLKGKHYTPRKNDYPSPATYHSEVKLTSKQYSFPHDTRRFQTQAGPGPAQYSPTSSLNKTGIHFPKEERMKTLDNEINLGPGQYIHQTKELSPKKDNYSFSKEKKFMADEMIEKNKKSIPGPGAYDMVKFKKRFRGGKFTQGARAENNPLKDNPGPLSYNPTYSTLRHNPTPTIGNSLRLRQKTEDIPGPGSYNTPDTCVYKRSNGNSKFTQGNRTMTDFSQTPGPGAYKVPEQKQKGYSITSRHSANKLQRRPGPQDYDIKTNYVEKHSGQVNRFGSEKRMKNALTEAPGPGAYSPMEKRFNETHGFSKSISKDQMSMTVGPGTYKLKPYFGQCDGLNQDPKDILYV